MYEFIDRPVTSLDHGGRFLVWSMRIWVKAAGEGQCPVSAVAPAFAKWQMIGGLAHFHKSMLMFNRDALEQFGFCALQCNHVSEHEAIILSLICSLRDARPQTIRDTLVLVIEEDSIGDLLGALTALGNSLEGAGIFPVRSVCEPGRTSEA
jgi:hypothetical protein